MTSESFLLDSNIIYPVEPASVEDVEETTPKITRFMSHLRKIGGHIFIHPAISWDLARDRNMERREIREVILEKYNKLPDPPSIPKIINKQFGNPDHGSNEWVDLQLLATLKSDAVDFLVTEDRTLRNRAHEVNLGNRIFSLDEALAHVESIRISPPPAPPSVQSTKAHALQKDAEIFSSLREEYPGFQDWFQKCCREQRDCLVIEADDDGYRAISILKKEERRDIDDFDPDGLNEPILKICTFKVAEQHRGQKYGELLLKSILKYGAENKFGGSYLTVKPKYNRLQQMLEEFGFTPEQERTKMNELIMSKPLMPSPEAEEEDFSSWEFHRRFGPPAIRFPNDMESYIIPIQPQYHYRLFPQTDQNLRPQKGLFEEEVRPSYGNAIRKAYISRSNMNEIPRGALVLFYRSGDVQGLTDIGVVESTQRYSSPKIVYREIAKRTVYRQEEIEELCESGNVLVILFRHCFGLENPISLTELTYENVVNAAPQSVQTVSQEGIPWLKQQLNQTYCYP